METDKKTSLEIILDSEQIAYIPANKITGKIKWNCESRPKSILLNLIWFTKVHDSGDTDVEIVANHKIERMSVNGEEKFDFMLPTQPYSYNGILFDIRWALELLIEPNEKLLRKEFIVSDTEEVIKSVKIDEDSNS